MTQIQLDEKLREVKTAVRQYIREEMLKIDILKSKGLNAETLPQIYASYEKCVSLSQEYQVSILDTMSDYSNFLFLQKKYERYTEVLENLTKYLRQITCGDPKLEKIFAAFCKRCGNLYALLAKIECINHHEYAKLAHDYYTEADRIYNKQDKGGTT